MKRNYINPKTDTLQLETTNILWETSGGPLNPAPSRESAPKNLKYLSI